MATKTIASKAPVEKIETKEEARPRGRPCDPDVRDRILTAAREHFLERGLDGASIEKIAESAGTSKVTVYKHFPSKEELFSSVANEARINKFSLNVKGLESQSPEEALTQVANDFWSLLTEGNTMVYFRFLVMNAVKNPSLAESFITSGPAKIQLAIARLLGRFNEKGVLSIDDPCIAAEQFVGMLKGGEHLNGMLGLPWRKPAKRKEYVNACVAMFLRAYGK
jgi:TetR/AcrR family transcriptional repressor of mexJK operon